MASLTSIFKKTKRIIDKVDPLTSKLLKAEEKVPGSIGALSAAVTSDAPSNPYARGEASKSDIFAGGTKLSQSERARKTGRAIGTIAALYFGAGAMSGGSSSAAGGGAATTGAASTGIAGTGVTATEAVSAGATALSVAEQQKAQKASEAAMQAQSASFDQSLQTLRRDQPKSPSLDEARRRAEMADAQRRKRGRRASILTGDTGVGATPISQRTLIGA